MQLLLIEDNEDDWVIISEFLWDTDNVTVNRSATLAQGLAYLQDNPVDVLLLDMGLPDSVGLQTFLRIKAQHPALPVVILSGDSRDEQALAAVHNGAQDYLVKGEVSGPLLVRSLRYAQERKQAEVLRQRYAQTLEILQVIDRAIIQATSVSGLAHTVFRYLQRLIPFQDVCLLLVDKVTRRSSAFAFDLTTASPQSTCSQRAATDDEIMRFSACLTSSTSISLLSPSETVCPNMIPPGMAAALQALLVVKEGLIGTFTLAAAGPETFQPDHLEILAQITNQLAVAIDRLQLMERQAEHASLLEKTVAQRTEQLQAAKERAESILNHSLDGMVLLDHTLCIRRANPAFQTLFCEGNRSDNTETNPQSYIGKQLVGLIAPDDAKLVTATIHDCLATRQEKYVEALACRTDGTQFDIELSIGYVDQYYVVCTMRNISARKLAEAALQDALEREKELNQLKSQFVAMTSHEFRTPLAAILVLVESLSYYRHKMTAEQVDQRLNRVKSQVGYLTEVMDDILCLARLQSRQAEFKPVIGDMDALCRTIIKEFTSRSDIRHDIRYTCNGPQRHCMIDDRLMRQVLSNLLSNAIKYSPNATELSVYLEYQPTTMVLSVQDAGIGIPDNARHHLFEPFLRADNVAGIAGTGLGLTIVKESVERHQGTIAVTSALGQGTTFTVTVPIQEQSTDGSFVTNGTG